MLYILPKQTRDVGEQLDVGHATQKPGKRKFFMIILQNVKFLARQSLPLRGDGREDNSNLKQLFLFQAEDNPTIYEWLS